MKTRNFLIGFFVCVLGIFLYNNGAKADEPSTAFAGPRLIYACVLDDTLSKGIVICYVNGAHDKKRDKKIDFKDKVAKIYMTCADPVPEMNDTRVWIAANYQNGSSELWGTDSSGNWKSLDDEKHKRDTTTIGGISLSTDGSVGWVAVNDGPNSQIERWQLTDSKAVPTIIPVKDTKGQLGNITNIAANIVNGQDNIWCVFQQDTSKVYKINKNGSSDSNFPVDGGIGAWNINSKGTLCVFPRITTRFSDSGQYMQPGIKLFTSETNSTTLAKLDVPEANAESGVTLGENNTITYINYQGNICVLRYDPKDMTKLQSSSEINLTNLVGSLRKWQRYITATSAE